MYDVIIIGAGVSGAASAREISRYKVHACVLEKEEDVCCGTSKANSAIVHAGYDAENGSLMAKLNVEGSKMMAKLAKDLDFEFIQNGSLVVCTEKEDRPELEALLERGRKNGVEGLRIVEREELAAMEPNISDEAVAALYAPTGGIVCPFNLNIALAENAFANGVEFQFNTEVEGIEKIEGGFRLKTSQGVYEAKCVVNAAGVYADKIHNMVSEVNTTREGLDEAAEKSARTVKNVPLRQVITSFAGLRAHEAGHEFIIGELKEAPGFVDCAGIESPGLTSSPAIGRMVADTVKEILGLEEKEDFIATRKGVLNPEKLSLEERNALIKKQPAYGNIICRCEMVTEGEILDAIHRPLGAKSLDGVKRRTRAGMGRCQAGFCSPRTMEILSRELKLDMEKITKSGGSSVIVVGTNKDRL